MKIKLAFLVFTLAALVAGRSGLAAEAPPVPRVIHITAGKDNTMKFDVTVIPASPGELITVVLTNAGTLPKNVMGHNWILLKAGSDPVAFAAASAANADNGYIPTKPDDRMLAHIGLLGPNESGEVTFAAPTAPGDYPFLCAFPAHCLVGMKGVLTVK
jgi:azurin